MRNRKSTNSNKVRVLFLEDVPENYWAVQLLLESRGYELLRMVSSLKEAEERIRSEKPDVLLVDLELEQEQRDRTKVVNYIAGLKKQNDKLAILVHSGVSQVRLNVVRTIVGLGISYLTKDSVRKAEDLDWAIDYARRGWAVYDVYISNLFGEIIGEKSSQGPLTARQWEVAALVSRHMNDREIAESLVISPLTVREHVGVILNRLGFGRRSEIIVWFNEQKRAGRVPTSLLDRPENG